MWLPLVWGTIFWGKPNGKLRKKHTDVGKKCWDKHMYSMQEFLVCRSVRVLVWANGRSEPRPWTLMNLCTKMPSKLPHWWHLNALCWDLKSQGCLFYACLSHRMFLVRKKIMGGLYTSTIFHMPILYLSFCCNIQRHKQKYPSSTQPIALGRCQRTFPNGPQQVRWGGLSQLVNLLPDMNYQQTLADVFLFGKYPQRSDGASKCLKYSKWWRSFYWVSPSIATVGMFLLESDSQLFSATLVGVVRRFVFLIFSKEKHS